jgi:hypothetical protein
MSRPDSPSTKSGQSASADALIALVRLLARQAAREFVAESPGQADSQQQAEASDPK